MLLVHEFEYLKGNLEMRTLQFSISTTAIPSVIAILERQWQDCLGLGSRQGWALTGVCLSQNR